MLAGFLIPSDRIDHRETMSNLFLVSFVGLFVALFANLVSAQSNWQAEWEKTLRAGESEGQVTLYGCCYEYDRVLEGFKKKYPKIKVSTVLASVKEVLPQK